MSNAKETVYLNPNGPNNVFFREKKFHDLVAYVPELAASRAYAWGLSVGADKTTAERIVMLVEENSALKRDLDKALGEMGSLRLALYRYEHAAAEAQRDMRLYYKPGESRPLV